MPIIQITNAPITLIEKVSFKKINAAIETKIGVIYPIAVTSETGILAIAKNDERGCWDIENERLPLIELIHQVRNELNLQKYPLYGFGASSGGSMMTELTTSPLPFCAVNIQISPLQKAISAPAAIYTFMKDDLTMLRFSKNMLPQVAAEKKIKIKILSIEKPMLDKKYFFNIKFVHFD